VKPDAVDFAIAMAPKLRRAGVTRFRCGDVEFDIGPEQDGEPSPSSPEDGLRFGPPPPMDPMDDGVTFGLPPGSPPPSYRRKAKEE
jgi:hypothetical protein